MKFVLLCEGKTEKMALPDFLRRWLDARLKERVGVKAVKYEGWHDLYRDYQKKSKMYLDDRDILGVIALLDLYGPTFYPDNMRTAVDKIEWGRRHFQSTVNHEKFRFFFAVHELEAWLLSDPSLFPQEVRNALPGRIQQPETVNFDEPPAQLLDKLYTQRLRSGYKKTTYGRDLFQRLNPDTAYARCPHLQEMLDEMLKMAQNAGF